MAYICWITIWNWFKMPFNYLDDGSWSCLIILNRTRNLSPAPASNCLCTAGPTPWSLTLLLNKTISNILPLYKIILPGCLHPLIGLHPTDHIVLHFVAVSHCVITSIPQPVHFSSSLPNTFLAIFQTSKDFWKHNYDSSLAIKVKYLIGQMYYLTLLFHYRYLFSLMFIAFKCMSSFQTMVR